MIAAILIVLVTLPAHAQLSGRIDLDMIGRRIPTTVTGEIKLDTPSEFTMFELAIASKLDLTVRTGFIDPHVQAAINTAGLEHFVFTTPMQFDGPLLFGFDDVGLVPEIWIAVPFENVVDVNNLPNSVMIPPGDPLLATARVTFSTSIAGFDLEQILMLDDVNFPSPSGSFDPLFYRHTDQDFHLGVLTQARWRANGGFSMNVQVGLSASSSSKSIKGHSSKGQVTPDNSFLRISVGGIRLATFSLFGVGEQAVVLGTSFAVSTGTDETYNTTVSISGPLWKGTTVSTSISFASSPPTVSQIRLSVDGGPFRLAIALDTLEILGLSASCGDSLNLGSISGSWSLSLTGLERGLTGMAVRLSLGQGGFSTDTSITFSERGDDFGFASWSTKLIFRFSPAVVSAQVTFGRYGLTRAAISTSVSF